MTGGTYLAIPATDPDANIDLAAFDPIKEEAARAGYTVRIGGPQPLNAGINDQVSADIARAESLSMPILLILLVFVFGSVVSALLPLAIGGMAIIGAFTALKVISLAT